MLHPLASLPAKLNQLQPLKKALTLALILTLNPNPKFLPLQFILERGTTPIILPYQRKLHN